MPTNSISGGPTTNLHSILCILIEILLRPHAKEREQVLMVVVVVELMLNVLRCHLTH